MRNRLAAIRPKGAHKLTAEVMAFIEQRVQSDGVIHARSLAQEIAAEMGLSVHPRSIERALARKKNRNRNVAAAVGGRPLRKRACRAPGRPGACGGPGSVAFPRHATGIGDPARYAAPRCRPLPPSGLPAIPT